MLKNTWSENKVIDTVINLMLILFSINFMHIGQLILPIICVIIFCVNKYKFRINNKFNFIVLCLFSIVFWLYSKKLGFYSTIAFCLPMAYYIGSNANKNEQSLKNVAYILAIGMALHVVLNFIYDIQYDGLIKLFYEVGHRDFWTHLKISATSTAVNYIFLIGIIGYLFIYENNKRIKIIGLFIFIIIMIYNFGLGRRTPILMLCIVIMINLLFWVIKQRKHLKKVLIFFVLIVVIVLITFFFLSQIDSFNQNYSKVFLLYRFINKGLNAERIEIFIEAVKIMPKFLWGGQELSNYLNIQIHDLWMDTYDYSGLFSYVLLVVYTLSTIKESIKLLINKNVTEDCKLFIFPLLCVIFIQMHLEPIITGSSIFLISTIMLEPIVYSISKGNNNG